MSKTSEAIDKLVAVLIEEHGPEILEALLRKEPVVESEKVTIMADSAKEMHKNEH